MCMFPIKNTNFNGIAYKKGVAEFECGACPECLRKRASRWALRAVYEAREHVSNIMCTLTYDDYIKDRQGNIIGELPPDRDLLCNVRDIQLFMKRFRKRFGDGIKYIVTAEHGKRTNRAHYHVLFFGVELPDCIPYKRSKRGNMIYKSATLTSLWGHGICTVDALHVGASVARYCTKYCAKDSRCADTFMLFSRNIGMKGLLEDFNGKSYMVEGREYPVPRQVFEKYICNKYRDRSECFSPKYVCKTEKTLDDGSFYRSMRLRKNYRFFRDSDVVYQGYLAYWKDLADRLKPFEKPVIERIRELPEDKYHAYKVKALECISLRRQGAYVPAPRAGNVSEWYHSICKDKFSVSLMRDVSPEERQYLQGSKCDCILSHLPLRSCHKTANDTNGWCLTIYKRIHGLLCEYKIPYFTATDEDYIIFDKNIS